MNVEDGGNNAKDRNWMKEWIENKEGGSGKAMYTKTYGANDLEG